MRKLLLAIKYLLRYRSGFVRAVRDEFRKRMSEARDHGRA